METQESVIEQQAPEPLFIIPIRDFIFKVLFGIKEFMASFLMAILDLPEEEYADLQITDPSQQPEYVGGKLNILDLKLFTKSGKIINIEIQTNDTAEIRERIVYALCKAMSLQLRAGMKYKKLERVIGIQITDFVLLGEEPETRFHNKYGFSNLESHKVFSDIIEMHILELPKVPKEAMDGDSNMLANWLRFLGAKSPEEVDMAAQASPIIQKAALEYRKISSDERMQWLEKQYIENAWREQDMLNMAYNDGDNHAVKNRNDELLIYINNGGSLEQLKKMLQ
jgi:predicted transposase/invertase (TIGR01784 family)